MTRLKLFFLLPLFIFSEAHSQIISTLAGNDIQGYTGDGILARYAEFNCPNNTTVDKQGRVYVADFWNGRIRVVTTDGYVITVAGNGTDTRSGDGGPATAAGINSPVDMAMDKAGNLYIATDSLTDPTTTFYTYSGSYIRKVDTAGIITTIAGNGTVLPGGDNGPATNAGFYSLTGIAVDDFGNIYVTDAIGNVRKIDAAGIITTVAGNSTYGFSGDNGPATAAQFYAPNDVAADHSGNLFVIDYGNNRVRKIDAMGMISTVAGCDTTALYGGDGGPATAAHLAYPAGVTVDDTGNIYIADRGNARIRKVNTLGSISTVAGDSVYGHTGDGGLADTAALYNPMGVAIDSLGNLYIADFGNEDVRMVTAYDATKVPVQQTSTDELRIWPEPNNGAFSLNMQCDLNQTADFRIVNIEGVAVQTLSAETNKMIPVQLHLPPGNYIVTCIYGGNEKSAKILIQ